MSGISVIRKPEPLIPVSIKNSLLTLLIILIPLLVISFVMSFIVVPKGGLLFLLVGILITFIFEILILIFSKDIMMAMLRARRVTSGEIFETVREIANKAKIPMPELYIIPDPTPNAFAVGILQSRSAVGLNAGIIELLNRNELRGVIAHEIAHIKNRDTLLMTAAAVLFNSVGMIIDFIGRMMIYQNNNRNAVLGLGLIIFSFIFRLIVTPLMLLALSRTREYIADETGARLINDPLSLASALEKIENYYERYLDQIVARAEERYESNSPIKNALKMMYIGNTEPKKKTSFWREILSTHPPTEKRIERLRELARELGVY